MSEYEWPELTPEELKQLQVDMADDAQAERYEEP